MTATVSETRLHQVLHFYEAPIGKKVVMAVTGVILFGFVLGHMAGNLQVFLGREVFDHYAELLRQNMALLWAVRLGLLAAAILHIVSAVQLSAIQKKARPQGYAKKQAVGSSLASRTMLVSGLATLAFLIYHLLHLTFGTAHPAFEVGRVYDNVITAFRSVPISIAYIAAMILVGMHLNHGLWSMFQSLGLANAKYSGKLRLFARTFAAIVTIGFIAVPVAVLAGLGS
jgi:succinate dehydrogenase / fumarate reductase cytochrome b subunit